MPASVNVNHIAPRNFDKDQKVLLQDFILMHYKVETCHLQDNVRWCGLTGSCKLFAAMP